MRFSGCLKTWFGPRSCSRGFTLLELASVLGVSIALAVLLFLQFQSLWRSNRVNPLQCQENLRMIGFALAEYSQENQERYPWQVASKDGGSLEFIANGQSSPHFQPLTRYIRNTKNLKCPLDPVRMKSMSIDSIQDSGISYFLNLSAKPDDRFAVLLGDRTISTSDDPTTGELEVSSGTAVQWTQPSPDAPGHVRSSGTEPSGNVYLGSQALIETSTPQLRHLLKPLGERSHKLVLP